MLPEISLNVLDVTENSTSAGATLIRITIEVDRASDFLKLSIADNGCGMTKEQVMKVTDPFYTTRTTRKVGLGVPFLKNEAEMTGGDFTIESEPGVGTTVKASFGLSNIDRMPLGDITSTIHNLIVYHPDTDFVYRYTFDGESFELDTRELRDVLGDVPLDNPDVSQYIKEYLKENKEKLDNGITI